jgi:hypothetical protein
MLLLLLLLLRGQGPKLDPPDLSNTSWYDDRCERSARIEGTLSDASESFIQDDG